MMMGLEGTRAHTRYHLALLHLLPDAQAILKYAGSGREPTATTAAAQKRRITTLTFTNRIIDRRCTVAINPSPTPARRSPAWSTSSPVLLPSIGVRRDDGDGDQAVSEEHAFGSRCGLSMRARMDGAGNVYGSREGRMKSGWSMSDIPPTATAPLLVSGSE